MNRMLHHRPSAPAFDTAALAASAWDASPADIGLLVVHVEADEPAAASASACASLPATTSAWLDGLLGLHRPLCC